VDSIAASAEAIAASPDVICARETLI